MTTPVYECWTEAAVALSAATARTILGVKAHANSGIQLGGFEISFDGVTASAVPVLVEIGYCTWATKSPGTNSTSCTIIQRCGVRLAAGFTAAYSWAAGNEPTVITVGRGFTLSPNGGVFSYQYPLGKEPDSAALAEGWVVRCTAPAAVNARASMFIERI